MKIKPFELERYFAKYEFTTPYLLSPSDCEPLSLQELLTMGDEDSLKKWENLSLAYTESQGHLALREEIAKLYADLQPNDFLVVAPEEGIFIAMNVLLEKGDHAIATFPGYQSLYEIASSLGCEVSKWMPNAEEGWKFNIEELRSLVQENTKLIVINFPHNPTGAMVSKEDFEQILQIAKEKSIFVFSDEMYRFLEYDEADRLPSASELYENAVSLFGVSKSFALPGLRMGWLATKNSNLLSEFLRFKDYTTICPSAPSEILALMALRAKDKILERNLDIIKNNLYVLDEFFNRYSDLLDWVRPKAGTIAFPKLKGSQSIADFCLDLVEKKGVMLLPATVYSYEGNNFRVGFGRKNTSEALTKLEEYIQEQQ
jgi:aspartate/methionine/tyrosine aminotransferase